MKTQNLIRHICGCFALVAGLLGAPAWGAGTTTQTLTWTGTTNEILLLDRAYLLAATSSSGLPVTLRVDTGPAVLAGGSITAKGAGTVWVTAEQAGDATFAAARLQRSFNVQQAVLTRVGLHYIHMTFGVQVVGDYAYVAAHGEGLEVIDVRDPTKPVRVGGYDTGGSAIRVQVVGNLAYVADSIGGLQILDVTNAAKPIRVGGYRLSSILDVQVVGRYAYVAVSNYGLHVIDVSDPTHPVRVGLHTTFREARAVKVVGDHAYIADWTGGLHVFDVHDPANPVRVGRLGTSGYAGDLEVVGDYAYVANGINLAVVDVRDPVKPVLAGKYATETFARGVKLVGTHAYLAEDLHGVLVIDVSNPASPLRVGEHHLSGAAEDVDVVGNHAYVVGQQSNLEILELRFGLPNTLDFAPPADIAITNRFLALPQTSSGGAIVTYTVLNGPAQIDGDRLAFTGAGTVRLRARQVDDGFFLPLDAEWTINVSQVPLTILWPGSLTVTNPPAQVALHTGFLTLPTTTSTGEAVTYTVLSGPAQVAGDQLTFNGTGVVRLRAEQPADGLFLPVKAEWTINIYLAAQAIVWPGTTNSAAPPARLPITDRFLALPLTASSGKIVTYTVGVGSPAKVEGGRLVFNGPGKVALFARQGGDGLFAPLNEAWTIEIHLLPRRSPGPAAWARRSR